MLKIDLSGKIAVVTGASGKLGRVMATTLAEAGADVAVHYYRNAEPASVACDKIREMGRKASLVQADVTSLESIQAMRRKIEAEIGSPDILVTSAIGSGPAKLLLEQDPDEYARAFASTAIHNVMMAQTFVPAMIPKRWGRIIAISTEVVMINHATMSVYSACKRGMDGVLKVLAGEIGEYQITVNQVAPGWTISEIDRLEGTEKQEHYDKDVPLRRRGEDRDIANAVAFLASDLAGFITGVFLPVCGGNVMTPI